MTFNIPRYQYSSSDMAQIVELPLRKVLSFIERGYITPSVQEASGHGSKRLWDDKDLVRCAAIKVASSHLLAKSIRILATPLSVAKNIQDNCFWLIAPDSLIDPVILWVEPDENIFSKLSSSFIQLPFYFCLDFRILNRQIGGRLEAEGWP